MGVDPNEYYVSIIEYYLVVSRYELYLGIELYLEYYRVVSRYVCAYNFIFSARIICLFI